uniref:Integrase, catalytic region, zinc finger, CCHC-type, peptidase aspartic, catalytic n=1 Tax=Tanacetum cinerariifolium TaxID=118510 RepID=A0A6L2KFV0_TANCI|nr:integrase, catalytic region, zinc finger, CCHC-type, peptidase aspartic, catalytic [Tanacetum cinerariifolium]
MGHLARNYIVRPRRRDAAYLQTQMLIAQKEEVGIQLQAKEFDLIAAVGDLDEIEKVNANNILMANLRQASTSGTQTNKALVYDSYGSAEVVESNDLSNPVTSNSIPTTKESKVVKNDKVIALGMFRINPFKNSRVENVVPSKPVKASVRTNPITVSQANVITKQDVNSNSNSSCRLNLFMVHSLEHMTENLKLLINFVWKFPEVVRFGNDHIAAILGYGDLQWGNILITRVYFVKGFRHNLFSIGQFCDLDLENDREDIGKLGAKGDIGFFTCYFANSCAYIVYNRRTKKIMEMMNVTFDELSAMAFEQRSSQPSAAPTPQVLQTPSASTTTADTTPTPTNSSSHAADIPNSSQDVDELP